VLSNKKALDVLKTIEPGPAIPNTNIYLREKLQARRGSLAFAPGSSTITGDDLMAMAETVEERYRDKFTTAIPFLGKPPMEIGDSFIQRNKVSVRRDSELNRKLSVMKLETKRS
jgi:hypothetical protein